MSFLALSVLALAGMAVGNVLAPVFVKRFFPGHVAGMMSVYTTVLPIGALAPSLLVPVIFASHPGNWQLNLGVLGCHGRRRTGGVGGGRRHRAPCRAHA